MDTTGRIFLALDGLGEEAACELVKKIAQSPIAAAIGAVKVHDLWDQVGPRIVKRLRGAGAENVFVDLKLHDVPKTVGLRAKAAKENRAYIVTVHASGSIEMMRRAVENGPNILAITILTSLTEEEIHLLCGQPSKAAVLQRAHLAKLAGVWGLVCSPNEVGVLAGLPELEGLELVTPGIRLEGKDAIDANQKRVNSPDAAFKAGATRIVVGSEATKAEDPLAVLARIVDMIASVPEKE